MKKIEEKIVYKTFGARFGPIGGYSPDEVLIERNIPSFILIVFSVKRNQVANYAQCLFRYNY
jgi:hypothetical protein